MQVLLGVVGVLAVAFLAFRIEGKVNPRPMAIRMEQFFLGNPLRLRFFGPRQALALLGDVKGQRVAEIGVGIGVMVEVLANRVGPDGVVYGIDIQPEALQKTRRRLRENGLEGRVQLFEGKAQKLPWDDASLDRVIMVAVLGEVPPAERIQALREIRRVLKPDGRFILTEFWPDPHYLSIPLTHRLLSQAGLNPGRINRFPMIYTVESQVLSPREDRPRLKDTAETDR